ncbi:MAG: NifU family protein [Anaerolineae bacterium]
MIEITDTARQKLTQALGDRPDKVVHLSVDGRGQDGFNYVFRVLDRGDVDSSDIELEHEGFTLFLDHTQVEKLRGATLDYFGLGSRGSFRVDNPNAAWDDPLARSVHAIIVKQINPGIAAHGGYVTLVDVKGSDVYIEFGGGCMGCGASQVTLKYGIERMIRDAVPNVGEIIDVTNHAEGENPYYAPDVTGDSPLTSG